MHEPPISPADVAPQLCSVPFPSFFSGLVRVLHSISLVGAGCTLSTVNNKIVLLGGAAQERALNDVRIFELESAMWQVPTVSGTPPPALVGHSATLVGTELFVFGGSDGKHDGNELYIFDTETHQWTLPSLEGKPPGARIGHTGTGVGATKIYYFGGYGIRLGYSQDTHILDTALLSCVPAPTATKSWPPSVSLLAVFSLVLWLSGSLSFSHPPSLLPPPSLPLFPPPPRTRPCLQSTTHHQLGRTPPRSWSRPYVNGAPPPARVGHSAAAVGTRIYMYGGAANERIFKDMHVLDVASMSWMEPPTGGISPGPLFGHTAETVGKCVFLFGGAKAVPRFGTYAASHGRTFASNKIHVLDTESMAWSKPNVAGISPLPRYRHATAMFGSQMFMFGGFGGGADFFALDTGILDEQKLERDAQKRRRRANVGGVSADSANDLIHWLEALGLGKYTRVFIRQEVDFETLVELSGEDLREMGIVAIGPRKKLVAAISAMRALGQGKYSTADLYQGRYKLEETSSMGGLNSVKLAVDLKTEKKVALKFMSNKEAFLREVSFLKQLRSEFVVELIDYYEASRSAAAHHSPLPCLLVRLSSCRLSTRPALLPRL